ncbi:FkbM family methyltransferase [Telmatospirillum siberiense]|uniref:FkbM family methyltransferase n=1 Tax=Telmatospirillum siberiense TaxID=382514 RepID=A0A2N3PVN2_9PROT|nr:FkbM family methyltransferase [Telmatospirillum siberiense]PKU24464.1 FkbM family methyltransferase [Telmatospirillum siberiense]
MIIGTRIRKFLRIIQVPAFRRALMHGVAATVEHAGPLRGLSVASVLDIGANNGQFALLARHLWPAARISSFEPLADASARFSSVLGNDPSVNLFNVALGVERGEADFHVSRRADSSSMLAITNRQTAMFPGTEEISMIKVPVDRLDALLTANELRPPVLLKIDVQGFEIPVLEGSTGIIDRVDHVYCECSFKELYQGQALAHQVVRWLDDRGFALRGVYNLSYDGDGRAVQGDFLFERLIPAFQEERPFGHSSKSVPETV